MEAREFVADLVASGLTQREIAERTGIPQPTISKVLRGDVNDVMSRNYRKLEALHLEVVRAPGTEQPSAA
jgi:transcriptional regulator with XRE-family HTH domain